MKKILGVGIATLDLINVVPDYPQEDEELRILSQRVSTGGNVTNTLTVLSQASYACDFAGVLGRQGEGSRIASMMQAQGINIQFAQWEENGYPPVSYITLNQKSGSRTILHHRDLPELSFSHFSGLRVDHYDWIHFEGRNVEQTCLMMENCLPLRNKVSLEIEKQREQDVLGLIPYAGTVMFSQFYMKELGYFDPVSFLSDMYDRYPETQMTCTLGDKGAYGIDAEGEIFRVDAEKVDVIDTIGAGDAFNAGVIDALMEGENLSTTLQKATRLAGRKVSLNGFTSLLANHIGETPEG